MFSEFIINIMGFKPMRADADVYIRRNVCNGGTPYYEYLLVYVDNVLVTSHAPEDVMKQIGSEFEIKSGEYSPPTSYLRAGLSKVQLGNDKQCWSMDSKKYVKAAVDVVWGLLAEDGWELRMSKSKHEGPIPTKYVPELDATPHCDEGHASWYRQIIGILQWAIELGRVDILTEVSLLSQQADRACGKGISQVSFVK
jgi:hypothetical protein